MPVLWSRFSSSEQAPRSPQVTVVVASTWDESDALHAASEKMNKTPIADFNSLTSYLLRTAR